MSWIRQLQAEALFPNGSSFFIVAPIVFNEKKEMKNIPPEERAAFGKGVNELKEWALNKFGEIDSKMKELELKIKYKSEKIDVTMPAKKIETGNLHPITQMKNELIDEFAGMGFEIYE